MKINWIKKLTSRKFWMAVASFVSMLIVAFGGSEAVAAQVTALIEAASQLYQYDGAVAEILWEEADYFYNGARTAAEAAALMQNRVQTYLDEQG